MRGADDAADRIDAMPKPNTAETSRNITSPALVVAASARSPSSCPIQIALIEPLIDWSTLDPKVGSANSSSVLPIGPVVRSRCGFAMDIPLSRGRCGLIAAFPYGISLPSRNSLGGGIARGGAAGAKVCLIVAAESPERAALCL